MTRKIVKNYVSENAAQNGCEVIGHDDNGVAYWSVDQGDGVAIEKDGLLYRVGFAEQLPNLINFNIHTAIKLAVDKAVTRITESGTFMGLGPAFFDLAGRFDEYTKMRDLIESRRASEEQARHKRQAEHEQAEHEALTKRIDEGEQNLIDGKSVSSEIFEELLKKYNIKAPIKTIGWARKSLYRIHATGYSIYSKHNKSNTIMHLMHDLINAIQSK